MILQPATKQSEIASTFGYVAVGIIGLAVCLSAVSSLNVTFSASAVVFRQLAFLLLSWVAVVVVASASPLHLFQYSERLLAFWSLSLPVSCFLKLPIFNELFLLAFAIAVLTRYREQDFLPIGVAVLLCIAYSIDRSFTVPILFVFFPTILYMLLVEKKTKLIGGSYVCILLAAQADELWKTFSASFFLIDALLILILATQLASVPVCCTAASASSPTDESKSS